MGRLHKSKCIHLPTTEVQMVRIVSFKLDNPILFILGQTDDDSQSPKSQ